MIHLCRLNSSKMDVGVNKKHNYKKKNFHTKNSNKPCWGLILSQTIFSYVSKFFSLIPNSVILKSMSPLRHNKSLFLPQTVTVLIPPDVSLGTIEGKDAQFTLNNPSGDVLCYIEREEVGCCACSIPSHQVCVMHSLNLIIKLYGPNGLLLHWSIKC